MSRQIALWFWPVLIAVLLVVMSGFLGYLLGLKHAYADWQRSIDASAASVRQEGR